MIFTVEEHGKEQTYEGFVRCMAGYPRPAEAMYLALAQDHDGLDLWWLAGDGIPLQELQRYYRMTMGCDVPIQLFSPIE